MTAVPVARRATFYDVFRFEWRKFRTVPSTAWCVLVAVVVGLGLSLLITLVTSHHFDKLSASDQSKWDPTAISTSGLALAALALVVLAVLMISSEFSSGMIQSSLAAVPKRYRVLAAKVLVFALVALVVGEVIAFVSFFIGQLIIHGHAPSVTLGDHDVLRAVIGPGLYVAVLGVLGLSIATIVRAAAGGIAILVAILYVIPAVAAGVLSGSIEHSFEKYWPTQAGQQITNVYRSAHTLSPWAGFVWMCIVTAVVLVVAGITFATRDV